MKKPLIAALGVAAACAACCTFPLAMTLWGSGALAAGLAALYGWSNDALLAAGVATFVTAGAVGLGLWQLRRNRRTACTTPAEGSHCATDPQAGTCGCGPNA